MALLLLHAAANAAKESAKAARAAEKRRRAAALSRVAGRGRDFAHAHGCPLARGARRRGRAPSPKDRSAARRGSINLVPEAYGVGGPGGSAAALSDADGAPTGNTSGLELPGAQAPSCCRSCARLRATGRRRSPRAPHAVGLRHEVDGAPARSGAVLGGGRAPPPPSPARERAAMRVGEVAAAACDAAQGSGSAPLLGSAGSLGGLLSSVGGGVQQEQRHRVDPLQAAAGAGRGCRRGPRGWARPWAGARYRPAAAAAAAAAGSSSSPPLISDESERSAMRCSGMSEVGAARRGGAAAPGTWRRATGGGFVGV